LTDINNTSCTFEFIDLCKKEGIHPIAGVEFQQNGQSLYIGLARNAEGLRELNQLLSEYSLSGKPLPESPPPMDNAWIIFPRLSKPIGQFRDNELLGIRPEHVNRLFSHELRNHQHKLVVLSPVAFLDDEGYQLHRLLRAIDLNVVLSKLTTKDVAKKTERLMPPDALLSFYQQYPRIVRNTKRIAESCRIDVDRGLHHNRQTFTGSKEGDYALLEKLAVNGCRRRYGADAVQALERIQKELKIIRQQDFCSYFLITWDIVRYAQSAGYHHVGRGSGANSIVAYCLGITDVDPIELDLYFERFINPYRASPPDFDIDFSWDERDDVTDYIFKRYGRDYTALLATYSTFQGRAIVRELGKVFGLPKAEIDKIVDEPGKVDEHHELAKDIFRYGSLMEGFPNYLSIHAGGIVISERPIYYFTALQMMPKGFPITHFDMHHAEDLGFHKFDVLSQRGLGHIKDAIDLARENQGRAVDIHDVERIKQDSKVKAQLRSGQCIGCFYIESPAMRGLLRKLRCDNYVHLVAAGSIIRPGVAKSGMMREYIHRFHHPDSFEYLHPVFREHLGETFGVMVYQEDVMKIIHHFAGLDLDESDVLRRIMTGKKHKGDTFEKLRQKYFDNCKKRGHSDELAAEVWRQIESFSGYSFCKAHSASFAVESFQSLYLKAHFPLEFMTAVINNFGGFYRTEYYVHEARMAGAAIHAPCVNRSLYLTTINGVDIYLGFVHLQGMERAVAHRIVLQRARGGPFRDLEDFVNRVEISAGQLEILIRIGAFRFTGKNKYELMWEKNAVWNPKGGFEHTLPLFDDEWENTQQLRGEEQEELPAGDRQLPELEEGRFDQAFDEIELLGFPLRSPFELVEKDDCYDCITAKNLKDYQGRIVKILGYYVVRKEVRTVKGQIMCFGAWLDREGQYFDTTHFPNFLLQHPFRGKGVYMIEGKVVMEFGFPGIEVIRMERLPFVKDDRYDD
jgi:DNA-directed DNA polymerase III PolC